MFNVVELNIKCTEGCHPSKSFVFIFMFTCVWVVGAWCDFAHKTIENVYLLYMCTCMCKNF